jgi:hypothetical protein
MEGAGGASLRDDFNPSSSSRAPAKPILSAEIGGTEITRYTALLGRMPTNTALGPGARKAARANANPHVGASRGRPSFSVSLDQQPTDARRTRSQHLLDGLHP